MARPALSVVIPNYRRPSLLRTCLASVERAVAVSDEVIEVVVVDDGSQDSSCDMVRGSFPDVRLVALETNRGYAAAVNAGISRCSGDWIFTLNNDTTVAPDLFTELLRVAQVDPTIGSVAAQQRFSSRRGILYSAGLLLDRRVHPSDRLMGHSVGQSETVPTPVFGACGAAALYRRSMLDVVGTFDEEFTFGLEDVDLAWRAKMRGWQCMYAPSAIVYHDLGGTVRHGSSLRLFTAGENRVRLIAKNLEGRQLLRSSVSILLFDLAYVAFCGLTQRNLSPARGRLAGMKRWKTARRQGATGRRSVELAPSPSFRSILRRRAAWSFAGAPDDSSPSAQRLPQPTWAEAGESG